LGVDRLQPFSDKRSPWSRSARCPCLSSLVPTTQRPSPWLLSVAGRQYLAQRAMQSQAHCAGFRATQPSRLRAVTEPGWSVSGFDLRAPGDEPCDHACVIARPVSRSWFQSNRSSIPSASHPWRRGSPLRADLRRGRPTNPGPAFSMSKGLQAAPSPNRSRSTNSIIA